jgi:hypothetical protein
VTNVELRDANTGALFEVWAGTDTSLPGTPVNFDVNWNITAVPIDAIKVTINSKHVNNDWEEIDAIQLHGCIDPPPPPASVGDLVWIDVN